MVLSPGAFAEFFHAVKQEVAFVSSISSCKSKVVNQGQSYNKKDLLGDRASVSALPPRSPFLPVVRREYIF